ncbi:hypothetical protein AB0D08_14855 [Kitasatospora sp. NPDC048540]|uniref:hypothetical protein n=1 Tax=Kitasatospora sp. NPDC048540 TaxID=3155634 RepID=UPI0033D6414B
MATSQAVSYRQVVLAIMQEDIRYRAVDERQHIGRIVAGIDGLTEAQQLRVHASYMRAWRRNQRHSAPQLARWLLSLTAVLFSAWVTADAILIVGFKSEFSGWVAPAFIVTGAVAGVVAVTTKITLVVQDRWDFASPSAHRSDLVVDRLIHLLSLLGSAKTHWRDPRTSRRLRYQIQLAATKIARSPVRLRRTQWGELELRRAIRQEQAQVAAVLRLHADRLAVIGTQGEYIQICASVTEGLLAAVNDDWEGLTANAPEVTLASRLKRVSARFGAPLLLAGAALTLPVIPQFHDSRAAIYSSLLPLAALMALRAPEAVANSIRGVIDKVSSGTRE